MSIYETIGVAYVILAVAVFTVELGYSAWVGISTMWRQRNRGDAEEKIDLQSRLQTRLLERSAR